MGSGETFLWGTFGAFAAEALVWFSLRHLVPKEYPYWIRSPLYYVISFVMVAIGGVVALAYARSGTPLNAILAMQIGASAPLIIRRARDVVPTTPSPPDPSTID